ncbi:glycerol uptake facilitator protein [Luteibacter sp. UNCMF331Sha3.1]|jgi:glycerol uptake facilitator protein|uniref:MIP/aquaporin family protein n=1 Tax=Luteibacter sp. UNCMF331Sha3.1 TaxID=1502760 RepID=UPI0008AD9A06|nr:MIP/aquaporin family protein [Luteibacter sp. UNCMF331Sha3.1]SEM78106.1 glycerol uptake facilitator protein [Luteibacter sp. UNCMF331Sha3.1]
MSVYLSEFLGTMVMILLGDGVVAGVLLKDSKAKDAGWSVITWAWGLAVLMGIFVAAKSGAHMNPAITLAMASVGKLSWSLVPGYIVAQVAGAFTGAVLVYFTYLAHWRGTQDPTAKLGIFCTIPAVRSLPANLLTEVIGTFVLVYCVLAIGSNDLSKGLAPIAVALLVVVIGMGLGGPTGYAINPARDFGPRLAHALLPIPGKGGSDFAYAPVPIVGSIVGALLAAFAYTALAA